MLVEAAVVGGGPGRWRRRLDGFDEELRERRRETERDDPSSARLAAIDDDRRRLAHLGAFALPIVTEMAAWPPLAHWGEWLDRLDDLAPRTLRAPAYVRRVLADLRPMASVGPVSVDEVRMVLMERLRSVDSDPPSRRYGRVFVGSPRRPVAGRFAWCSCRGSRSGCSRASRIRIRSYWMKRERRLDRRW
jgi:hypothetical protein